MIDPHDAASGSESALEPTARPLPQTLEEVEERAEFYFRSARAPNTVKAYRHDLEDFATWCKVDAGGLSPIPAAPRTVSLYVT
ncbi:MAG: integrase, partial [Actinomycetota bacterium]|nr:integrase [Actinomycetota bacterium]